MNYMGGLTLQRAYNNGYNGSRRNLLVASIMDLQVMYVNARGKRYKYMQKERGTSIELCNDKTKRFE